MTEVPPWRPATAADVPQIAALVQAAYRGPGGWTNEIGIVEGRRIDATQLVALVAAPDSLIAVVDGPAGHVIGCCRVAAGEDGIAHLELFAVDPAQQRRGLGRGLVAVARREAARRFAAHTLEISVVSGQAALLDWYVRLGFRLTGRTHPFGDDPLDRPLVPGLHFVQLRTPLVEEPYALSWSGGKDSALALQALRSAGGGEPRALVTTITADHDRISMHGVRRELLRAQARSVGVELVEAAIPAAADNETYERAFAAALGSPSLQRARAVAFGDLFLGDVRAYREAQCAAVGLMPRFPLWHDDTHALAARFIADGFQARIVCLDPSRLGPEFAGRTFDEALLAQLPAGVDPCGENGEFHTFVTDGPGFRRPVAVRPGEIVTRDGFVFADLRAA